ncbi:hypothetical protein L2U69_01765 [Zavarzinia compransoris]|uniref:hypothetical protein n=1 Tax=Zavarzinia marina TaxID=2911065 RepID=UPI001F399DB5|nr:hypothetical protein [Zavarzinia marina]MCF4164372.1 hypothetical protein [Zavarzinia marina]
MATSLPAEKLARLLADLPSADGAADDRVSSFRNVLVERLNTLRPQRARRMFSSLLQSLLDLDPEVAEPPVRAPYVFRRGDIGGIWNALARSIYPEKAAEAAHLLDRLCVDRLVDEAIELPEARALREQLRVLTVTRLAQILGDRQHTEAFCTVATAMRDRQLPEKARIMSPIGPGQIQELIEVLRAWPIITPAIDATLRTTPPHADPEDAGRRLVTATLALGRDLVAANLPSATAETLPISLLNRREAYGAVAAYIAERNPGNTPRTAEAFVARLSTLLHEFAVELGRLAAESRKEDQPLVIDELGREHLGQAISRVDEIVGACRRAGLFDAPIVQPMLLATANDLMARLDRGPLGRSGRRYAAAVVNRNSFTSDMPDVRQVVGMLVRLRHVLRPTGLPIHALNRWRDQLVADVEFAVHKATRLEDEEESPLERFFHLERIEQMAEVIGSTIGPVLQPTSKHTQTIFAARLQAPDQITGRAHRLCTDFAAAIRDEIAKVRYWRNPDMVAFAELAATRGF